MTQPGDDLEALTHRPGPGPHRTTIPGPDGAPVETLADLPPLRDRLLFVGLVPSAASITAGHHEQGPLGERFWARLVRADILPAGTDPARADDALVARGHGIACLHRAPDARGAPSATELRAGVGPLWQKIAIWRPAAIVFIERRAAEAAAGRVLSERWGQLRGVALAGRPCFLMPGGDAPVEEVDEGLNLIRNLGQALPR